MPMAHVIVVASDPEQREAMGRYLTLVGMNVGRAGSGAELDRLLSASSPDLLVLDADLPGEDGLSIAARLRATTRIGILVLTARDSLDDKVAGLAAGADACLAKPAQLRELEATIRSLLRRLDNTPHHKKQDAGVDGQGAWSFDATDWALTSPKGGTVPLTTAEYRAMQALIVKPGVSVKREEIAISLGKAMGGYDDRSVDAVLARLRRKVKMASGEMLPIRSARGIGYAFTAPIELRQRPMTAMA